MPCSPARESWTYIDINHTGYMAHARIIILFSHFRVPELKQICVERCEVVLLDCILGCSDNVECLSGCIRLETECLESELLFLLRFTKNSFIIFLLRLPMRWCMSRRMQWLPESCLSMRSKLFQLFITLWYITTAIYCQWILIYMNKGQRNKWKLDAVYRRKQSWIDPLCL